ncbi:hypothetical protein K438DRAFT_1626410, partial [Mycena galopus ATCC 62051]
SNTGETQHHWTNAMTGIKLSLVEAIETTIARELDERTAREIEASLKNGFLTNIQNEVYHHMARGLQRQTRAAQKVRETHELTQYSKEITAQLADLKETRRQTSAKEKELREQLKTAKTSSSGSSTKRGRNPDTSRAVRNTNYNLVGMFRTLVT